MNTLVEVTGADLDLRPWFQRVEATLTRFDPESPLSQLNREAGLWVIVPPLLYQAVQAALDAARETAGAFDPTILDALIAAGYGRSFEQGPTPRGEAGPAGRWTEVSMDPALGAVRLPVGVHLDLGGIGKGLAVDGAAQRLKGSNSFIINAGGDLVVRTALGDAPVRVDVADPERPEGNLASFTLRTGAVATSSTRGRRWGENLHHIIDPCTGRPSDSDVMSATVVAARASWAEVLAKSCIVLGAERGMALLKAKRCHGLLVTRAGSLLATPGMEGYLYDQAQG